MLQSIFEAIFGCSHEQVSFPQTRRKGSPATYVVCLECGKEFSYDWKNMRVGKGVDTPSAVGEPQPVLR
ncbi:MAG: hypothetical protein ABSH49_08285 [Bryobacteraceae bacterium]|jgi:transcription elongation factor Elf1